MFESEISALIIIYDKQENNNPILFVSGLLTISEIRCVFCLITVKAGVGHTCL